MTEILIRRPELIQLDNRLRIESALRTFDHLPAWRCQSFGSAVLGRPSKGLWYLCGQCFAKRGSGPATSTEEMWTPGTDREGNFHYEVVPKNARCHQCGGRAWPKDPT